MAWVFRSCRCGRLSFAVPKIGSMEGAESLKDDGFGGVHLGILKKTGDNWYRILTFRAKASCRPGRWQKILDNEAVYGEVRGWTVRKRRKNSLPTK